MVNKSAVPFVVVGGISVILGGMVSAASAGAPSYLSAWAVAYLVLVPGVAQLVLGMGQAELAPRQPSNRLVAAEVLVFNFAHAAVLLGSLATVPVLTFAGAGLIVVAMAMFAWAVRGTGTHNRWLLRAFRAMVIVLLVTAPLGVVISHARLH